MKDSKEKIKEEDKMTKKKNCRPRGRTKDTNGDGHISKEEMEMDLEFKRKELEDADARRDAMRKMTWFALFGMLLYPFAILITSMLGYEGTAKIIGDIAPTYFVSVAAIVSGFTSVQTHMQIKRSK